VLHRPLLPSLASSAIPRIADFLPQGLSNSAWAFATLEVRNLPLRQAISASALRSISDFETQELNNTAWAFAFISGQHLRITSGVRQASLALGRRMDAEGYAEKGVWRNVVDITGEAGTPLGYGIPEVVVNTPGLVVIFKPAGWETDVYDVAKFGIPITPVARFYLLSSFLGSLFPKEKFPICHAPEHGFGFVHRLDQMSSGLIITTTTFESHRLLQWQMCSYLIERQYYILCHGLVLSTRNGAFRITGRILEGQGRMRHRSTYGERCRVDPRGKPAQSNVALTSHLQLAPEEEPYSVVAIDIVTGRQHQIRTHLQHIGHPTVYDGRYVLQVIRLQGCHLEEALLTPQMEVKPRPLPERHRAELALRGAYPW